MRSGITTIDHARLRANPPRACVGSMLPSGIPSSAVTCGPYTFERSSDVENRQGVSCTPGAGYDGRDACEQATAPHYLAHN
jgi:hypothetical protein